MSIQFASVDGVNIRYWDSGGSGPAVLMSHGVGESLEFWQQQMDALGGSMRLVAWDMPGFGESDIPMPVPSLQDIARTGWRLLDKLAIESAHLVGNSFGAAISLRMAGQRPDRTSSLLMANAAALGADVFFPFRLMSLPFLGELMNKPSEKAVELQIKSIVLDPQVITPKLRAAIKRNTFRPGAAAYLLSTLRMSGNFSGQKKEVCKESHDLLGQLKMPVLIMHGRQDTVLPFKQSEQAHASAPGSKLLILDNCGHTPQLEQPAVFNKQLVSLMKLA